MTRTREILGPEYDAPERLATELHSPKRAMVLAALERAEAAGDEDAARLMRWELAFLDLVPVPADGSSPWRGGTYEQYAEFYRLTPDVVAYGRERARETQDLTLKARYLELVLLRTEPRGRAWIDLQREILETYRAYVDGCRGGAGNDPHELVGLYIDRALGRVGQLLSRRGVVTPDDAPAWAEWLVGLAEVSRDFPVKEPAMAAQQRHRWVADYLRHLTSLPSEAASPTLRTRAVALLADAATYYQSTPLNDHFEHVVAETEAELRKSWGEAGTHERMVRRQFDALVRRAELHKSTGNGLLTAEFFRQARALVEQQRQYFTDPDVARLQRAEQEAIDHAVEGGEFASLSYSIEIPKEIMDYVRETPEATVQAIVEQAVLAVPNRAQIRELVRQASAETPVLSLFGRTVIAPGKVVGQTRGEVGKEELEIESRALMQTQLLGIAVIHSAQKGAAQVGLTAAHLVAPLAPMGLDNGSLELIEHGCERLIAGDFVSALHVLVPRIEDALRQHLKAVGFDTTDFRADVGDGTSRTDDATLGSLMRKIRPDGLAVRDYLGADLWDHLDSVLNSQTGLNLRNDFAHGLARPGRCTPTVAGVVLSLLYQLAGVAGRGGVVSTPTSDPTASS